MMHLNRFDLNLLVALDVLLREKNVTNAAERVFLSQPAMSAALRRLREYFDDPLLVRVGRDMELTARGLALVEPVREALLRVQATLGTQPALDPATMRRTFKLMMPSFLVPGLMPALLERIARDAPGVCCQLENSSRSGLTRLAYGDIDTLVTSEEGPAVDAFAQHLCSMDLPVVRWVCVVCANHPSVTDELTRDQFLSLPHLYVSTPDDLRDLGDAVRRDYGADVKVQVTTQNALEAPFMLRGTSLIAVLPERLVNTLRSSVSLRVFAVPAELVPAQRLSLLWHRRNEPDPGHAWLREQIRSVMRAGHMTH